jgi:neutral ceramidase
MSSLLPRTSAPAALVLALLLSSSAHAQPKSAPPPPLSEWKAGVASVIITPEKNMWMAGYAARKRPAEGKVQDLFAKALALEDQRGARLVIVTMDLIGIIPSLRQAVEAQARERHGLPRESLLLNASHTHSGPEYRLRPGREDEAREYTLRLEAKLSEVIGAALAELSPARLSWGQARSGFAMNRRKDHSLPPGHPNAGKVPNPDGPVDHAVPALRVTASDGELRAVLFGYACHNTCLGFYQYCGDYAGYAQEYLQAHRPGFTALFLMGCGGDQNPYPRRSGVVPGVSDLELTQHHGRTLANAVEMALVVNPRPVRGPLRMALEEVELAYANGRPAHPYPVQVVRFGADLTLVALGSEVVVDYSLRIKQELAGPAAVWVAGYSNDYTGYIPSLRVLREGGYEAQAGWADSVEERIMSQVHALYRSTHAPAGAAQARVE